LYFSLGLQISLSTGEERWNPFSRIAKYNFMACLYSAGS